jgi:hypothetical protein
MTPSLRASMMLAIVAVTTMLLLGGVVTVGVGVVVLVDAAAPPTTKATARLIKVLNESGSRVEIYWIHPQTRQTTILTDPHIMNGATFPLNSFVGHEFEGTYCKKT